MFAGVQSMDAGDRGPRFRVGDQVIIISPGIDRGRRGVVSRVSEHAGDFVHRYDVQFEDGTSKRYFGFELNPILSRTA